MPGGITGINPGHRKQKKNNLKTGEVTYALSYRINSIKHKYLLYNRS